MHSRVSKCKTKWKRQHQK